MSTGVPACASPAVNPDWWDAASPRADRQRAVALCHGCPIRPACLQQARLQPPRGLIQAGLRWDKRGQPHTPFPAAPTRKD